MTTPRYRVLAYKQGSASAKTLSRALDGLVLKTDSMFKPRDNDVIVNWGSQKGFDSRDGRLLNDPRDISRASNKLRFFELIREANPELAPAFWTDKDGIWDGDFPIVCRTVLNGHSGDGIVIANNRSELVDAPLYVKYINKQQEYRVHVGKVEGRKNPDKIIAVQRKARSKSVPNEQVNWKIRNHANGFVYVRQNVEPPVAVTDVARLVFEQTELDFGAVDVIFNEREGKAYALEVNTAPGMEGQTVEDYARYIQSVGIPNEVADHALPA